MTDTSLMPFGRYLGKPMLKVPAVYLLWLFDKGCSHTEVKGYIHNNLEALRNEAKKAKGYNGAPYR